MSSQLQDNLENLRLRATCSICTELYTKPKKLPNCSHVFCLSCVKRYLQTKLPNNFPPCPMCRKPITKLLKEINFLEPARAEEDIIDFVRPYENCDLCNKRERPTVKCLECSGLICENCQPVHSKLQPLHCVVSIVELNVINQLQIKKECKTHKNQTLDLYCLMCNNNLCLYCDKFSHTSCNRTYDDISQYLQRLRNSPALLHLFIISSDERKESIRDLIIKERKKCVPSWVFPEPMVAFNAHLSTPAELRVVQIKEFSPFVRQYLGSLKVEVNNDVEFYDQYIADLETLGSEPSALELLKVRIGSLKSAISNISAKGKTIVSGAGFLIEKSSDLEVAESALTAVKTCLQFFNLRKTYSFENRCTDIKAENTEHVTSLLRQISTCTLQEENCSLVSLFVARVELSANTVDASKALNVKLERESGSDFAKDFIWSKGESKLILNSIKCFSVKTENDDESDIKISDNSLHTNQFLDKTKAHTDQGVACSVQTIRAGLKGDNYVTASESHFKCRYDSNASCFTLTKAGASCVLNYKTYFVTMISAIPFINKNDDICLQEDESVPPTIICLIGARSTYSGLELLFLESEEENYGFTHGIAVCAKVVRFKQTSFIDGIRASSFWFLQDKDGIFSFLSTTPYHRKPLICYHSKFVESSVPRSVFHISEDGSESQVPVSGFNAELLCEMNGGMFYVKREDDVDNITIGRLKMTPMMKMDDIFSMKQDYFSIPLRKLIPLTMAEARNGDLVVVCAVEDDVTKLVMILPMKQCVEMLEVNYPSTQYNGASLIDLEMDSDGNIMYVLRHGDRNMWRVMTKYIMP